VTTAHDLRDAVCEANRALPRAGLVTMHSGNASGIDRDSGRLFIKPSGVDYDVMRPEDLAEVDFESGLPVGDGLRPSVDLPHHLHLYRLMPDVGAIVHTHSNYATAFAAVRRPIPVCLTAIADEFGGEIPCMPYVDNEGTNIGDAIASHRTEAPAILLGGHGVFAWGPTPAAAVKAAVMTEDVAKTVWLALQIGDPPAMPPEEVRKWNDRYHTTYGQAR
jgi:L-ribulose-5-phosphate 4-epimerase